MISKKLDEIFNHYTQNELANVLAISQWELLEKIKDNSFNKNEKSTINKVYEKVILIANKKQMGKKIFHIEFKNAIENEKHFYYGDLTILCNTHEIGISKYTLDRWDFETPFENDICIIRKSELIISKRSVK